MTQHPDRFEMYYCDNATTCRVNTFERGNMATCPGCLRPGYPLKKD